MTTDTTPRLRPVDGAWLSELREAAHNHGWRRENGQADGWCYFQNDTDVPGEVGLAVTPDGGAWFLTVSHPGVAAELQALAAAPVPRGMVAAWGFARQADMRAALSRAYILASTLPTLPLHQFLADVADLGDTEADRLTRVRIGQGRFRDALLRYWNGRCPLTGISHPALLRASHIVSWAECETDAERLDVHNGLLLAPHWDAAFDDGLVSFADDGTALFSPDLGVEERAALGAPAPIRLVDGHRRHLAWHRARYGF